MEVLRKLRIRVRNELRIGVTVRGQGSRQTGLRGGDGRGQDGHLARPNRR